jgi:hypothetical protein
MEVIRHMPRQTKSNCPTTHTTAQAAWDWCCGEPFSLCVCQSISSNDFHLMLHQCTASSGVALLSQHKNWRSTPKENISDMMIRWSQVVSVGTNMFWSLLHTEMNTVWTVKRSFSLAIHRNRRPVQYLILDIYIAVHLWYIHISDQNATTESYKYGRLVKQSQSLGFTFVRK